MSLIPKLADSHDCVGCYACKDICPQNAINSYYGKDGHVYMRIVDHKCIGCLKCQSVCNETQTIKGSNDLSLSNIYSAFANNSDIRKKATSGGLFASIALSVISQGGCIVGAFFDGKKCKHIVVDREEDIEKLQGSKYVSSSLDGVYRLITEELKVRDVLFSGVGCQCAAVIAYFSKRSTAHKLYTVDLVCGGYPSRILMDKFFENNADVTGIASFRSKDKYELIVKRGEKTALLKEKNLPLHGFNCGMTSRWSCYDCKYAFAHRATDLTIGDLWDYSIQSEEHSKGLSMAIVHSAAGMKLLSESDCTFREIEWEGPLLHNKRIVSRKQLIFWPRKNLITNSERMSYDAFVKLYCIAMKPSDFGMFLFRIYRYILNRLLAKKNEKFIVRMIAKYQDKH